MHPGCGHCRDRIGKRLSPLQRAAFCVAGHLHMSVAQLKGAMTITEFYGWIAYLAAQQAGTPDQGVRLADMTPKQMAGLFHD